MIKMMANISPIVRLREHGSRVGDGRNRSEDFEDNIKSGAIKFHKDSIISYGRWLADETSILQESVMG